jgi:sec-independent protein translocase protein TatC
MTTATRLPGARMPLIGHLLELRRRLLVATAAVVLAAVAGWFVAVPVLDALRAPLVRFATEHHTLATLNYDSIAGAFDLRFRIALYLALVLASPVWLYEIWAFVVPALTGRERRVTVGFLGTAVPLFLAGCASGWLVVPHMVLLLASFAPAGSATLVSASGYFDFVMKLVLALGAAFVLPVLLVLLNRVGVLPGRAILRSWRLAVLAVVCFTALVTPAADLMSMALLALPLLSLYFGAAGIALVHDRRLARRTAAALEEREPVLLALDEPEA